MAKVNRVGRVARVGFANNKPQAKGRGKMLQKGKPILARSINRVIAKNVGAQYASLPKRRVKVK